MIERVVRAAEFHQANLLIFDDDLRPAQAREIERATELKVIDRTELILDIFARRARTKVARTQVELAQLEYELPRLRRLWDHLERLGGGIGTRGPGETQLESDRRLVRTRITMLKKVLERVEKNRAEQRKRRRSEIRVALVGYTNAGKSTLMNALTDAEVFTEDLLFATLDPTTRRLELPGGHAALLTDTVGLIKKLPHHLVVSFHATLEEVVEADMLLHVVDVSRPDAERYLQMANSVLEELDVEQKPTRLVFNKIDRAPDESEVARLRRLYPGAIFTSAVEGTGLDQVIGAIAAFVESREVVVEATVPVSDGRTISRLYETGEVLDRSFGEEHARLRVRMPKPDVERLRNEGIDVRETS